MKISVLGCGRWGSFIGWYLSNNGHEVYQWGTEGNPSFEKLKKDRRNEYVSLNNNVVLTGDLEKAISFAEIVIISISSITNFRY